ncbi:hypothetical protein HPP92_016156 [Vanilla planifolia]|uniref:Uncharacterized protein n=1 Tax=Vanilla planifolia TaxID=51239 RepID=A0A835UT31_VANPL|nr:hypothetical protein HPP92_016156 [Vanilla planifolia]
MLSGGACRISALGSSTDGDTSAELGSFIVVHVQPPLSISAGLNPGAIPFGGPSYVEVPAFTAAIEAHQRRITDAILDHALQICKEKNEGVFYIGSYFFEIRVEEIEEKHK